MPFVNVRGNGKIWAKRSILKRRLQPKNKYYMSKRRPYASMTAKEKAGIQCRKKRYQRKLYQAAPFVECACGFCHIKIKSMDKYGRPKEYVSGHNDRKYEDLDEYKLVSYKKQRADVPELFLFQRASRRAREKEVPFGITVADVKEVWPKDGLCPVFGIKLEQGKKIWQLSSPTLDRLDPSKGYVKGNIAVISMKANMIKSVATSPDDVQKVADWMIKMRKS